MTQLSESAFLAKADAILSQIEEAVDAAAEKADVDIDLQRNGNVLQMDFENGSSIIVNSQAAAQEIWLAARAGGFHFRLNDAEQWVNTRDGRELFNCLSEYIGQQAELSGVRLHLI